MGLSAQEFVNRLRGFFELSENATLNREQTAKIRAWLESVEDEPAARAGSGRTGPEDLERVLRDWSHPFAVTFPPPKSQELPRLVASDGTPPLVTQSRTEPEQGS